MAQGEAVIDIDRSPDDVWALLRGFGTINEWMPGIDSCTVEGDVRTIGTMGIEIKEQLRELDEKWMEAEEESAERRVLGRFALGGFLAALLGFAELDGHLFAGAALRPVAIAGVRLVEAVKERLVALVVVVVVNVVVRACVIVTLSKGKNYAYLQHQSEFYFSIHRAALLA